MDKTLMKAIAMILLIFCLSVALYNTAGPLSDVENTILNKMMRH